MGTRTEPAAVSVFTVSKPREGGNPTASIEAASKPLIAATHGTVLGGGLELVLACDLVIASEKARFGLPETNLALIPGFGGCGRLQRRIGVGAAREMVLTGRMIKVDEAEQRGLVHRRSAPESLAEDARSFAEELAKRAPLALRHAKMALAVAERDGAEAAARLESEAFGGLFSADDTREGLGAFLEKRDPSFQGK